MLQKTLKKSIKGIVKKIFENFGLEVRRIRHEPQKIGMIPCLKGLADQGYKPNSILDIGAAVGGWTKTAIQFWPQAKYFLVEPLEERKSELTALSQTYSHVNFLLADAGSQPGELLLGVTKDLHGSSLLYSGILQRKVPVVTIDQLVAEGHIEQPQFMKLDVQGYELEVLQGAKIAMQNADFIILELQFFRFVSSMNLLHESIAWMDKNNFRPYEIVDVYRRPSDNLMLECDILFTNKKSKILIDNEWEK